MALLDPNAPVTVMHPQTGQPIVLPAYAAAQFPQLQIVDHEDNGQAPAPPPPPPPPPPNGQNSGNNRRKHMIGPAPLVGGIAGGPQAAPEVADTVPSVTGGSLPTEQDQAAAPQVQNSPDFVANPSADGANLIPQYDALGKIRPLGPGEFVQNKNGSWSNEITTTVTDKRINGGKPTVIPTLWVVNGKPTRVSEDQATDFAAQSGLNFPGFGSMGDAEKFANQREANWQKVPQGDTLDTPALWTQPDQAAAPNAPQMPDNALSPGRAAALGQSEQGIEEQKQAGQQQAQAEAAASRAKGDAYAQQMAQEDALDKQYQQQAQARLAEIDQRQAQINSAINAVSNMRVDQNIAHPTMAAIGVALGALGAALQHSNTNVALNVLNQQIERNTQVQMANINNARAAIGMQQGQLANLRSQFTNQNALYNAVAAANTRRAQTMLNQITERSNSDIVKAKGAALAGQLDQQAGQLQGQAVEQEQQERDRQTGFKLQLRGQNISAGEQEANRKQAASQFGQDLAFRQKQEADEMKARADALKQQGDLAGAKLLLDNAVRFQTGGVMQPTTLAADATGTYHPAGFKPLTQEDGTVYIAPKGREKDVQEFNTYSNQALEALDNVRALRQKNGGNIANTAQARQAVQELSRALMAEQNMSGTKRWSTELADIMQKKLTGGADINSVIRDVLPNLDQARADLVQDRNTYMRGANYTGVDIQSPDPRKMPRAPVSDESLLKTPTEVKAPTQQDYNQSLLSLHDAETMLYSGDPKKQQAALRILHNPNVKDRKTREVMQDIINHYMTHQEGAPPLLPDPNANPAYYQVR